MTKSQPVALLGEAPPRVLVTPQGVRANSWRDVADLSLSFGIQLDAWQELILEASMGERSDHTWAAKRIGISVPRQNGKSQLLVARALAGALLFGEKKIVVSAHQQDTARESFSKLMEIIEADENAALRSRLDTRFGRGGVMNALNREAVKFSNGAMIQFKARSGAAGKGFSSDCLLLDEAQILGSRAWTSINSTMSAMRNPQVWLLGTPPQDEDDCYAFDMVRRAAVDGKSTASAWCEWSADPGAADYDPATEYTRWQANPAWNTRINHEVVQGEFETYSVDRFAQDRLGIWRDENILGARVITADEWRATGIESPPTQGLKSFGVKFAPDGSTVAVAAARKPNEGPIHVELVGAHTGSMNAGTASLAAWLAERWRDSAAIVVDGRSHAGAFVNALLDLGVSKRVIVVPTWAEVATANAMLLDAVVLKQMTHWTDKGQQALDDSVAVSTKKVQKGNTAGAWNFESMRDAGAEVPVQAAALAHYGAKTKKPRTGRVVTA